MTFAPTDAPPSKKARTNQYRPNDSSSLIFSQPPSVFKSLADIGEDRSFHNSNRQSPFISSAAFGAPPRHHRRTHSAASVPPPSFSYDSPKRKTAVFDMPTTTNRLTQSLTDQSYKHTNNQRFTPNFSPIAQHMTSPLAGRYSERMFSPRKQQKRNVTMSVGRHTHSGAHQCRLNEAFISPLRSPKRRRTRKLYGGELDNGPLSPTFPKYGESHRYHTSTNTAVNRALICDDRYVPSVSGSSMVESFRITSRHHSNPFSPQSAPRISGTATVNQSNPATDNTSSHPTTAAAAAASTAASTSQPQHHNAGGANGSGGSNTNSNSQSPSPSQIQAEITARQMYTQVLQSELLGACENNNVPFIASDGTITHNATDENADPFTNGDPTSVSAYLNSPSMARSDALMSPTRVSTATAAAATPGNNTDSKAKQHALNLKLSHHPNCPCHDIRSQIANHNRLNNIGQSGSSPNNNSDRSSSPPVAELSPTRRAGRNSPHRRRANIITNGIEIQCCCDQITSTSDFDFLKSPTRTMKFHRHENRQVIGTPGSTHDADIYSMTPMKRTSQAALCKKKRNIRRIPKSPFKVLDAPRLTDDFYLNLVDWSQRNVLCVGLGECVYLWSAFTSKVTKLADLKEEIVHSTNAQMIGRDSERNAVCSVAWNKKGSSLGVGSGGGNVLVFDGVKCKKIRDLSKHSHRVGVLAWRSNQLVASGSRDRSIWLHDLRIPTGTNTNDQSPSSDVVCQFHGHRQEVCGMEWSHDDMFLASGGNDNKLLIWDIRRPMVPHGCGRHKAAVKAIAWSPHEHNIIATGGGTADRTIRFWDANELPAQPSPPNGDETLLNRHPRSLTPLQTIDTGSQVCNLLWSKNVNEIVSTHGYSLNQIVVWKYPTMEKLVTLTGHTYRVLYLAGSPDGQTIVTGAGDETLRFWNVLPAPPNPTASLDFNQLGSIDDTYDIR